MDSLILGNNILGMLAVIFSVIAISYLSENFSQTNKLPAVIWVLLLSALLANLNVIPSSSAVYTFIYQNIVPVAISLLLFKANFKGLFKEGSRIFLAFLIGSVGTILGAFIGLTLIDLGDVSNAYAAVFTATYIGGSMNFVAVSQVIDFNDPTTFSAAIAADNIVGTLYMTMLMTLLTWPFINRFLPTKYQPEEELKPNSLPSSSQSTPFISLHITGALALAIFICIVSQKIANALGIPKYDIIFITLISATIANLFPKTMGSIKGELSTGMILFYMFFFAIGASANVVDAQSIVFPLIGYASIIILSHFVFMILGAKLFKLSIPELIIGSNSSVLGPPTAAAIAASKGWKNLITPGILCGVFGYVVANLIGVAIFHILT